LAGTRCEVKSLPIHRPTLDDPIYSQKNPHQAFLLVYSALVSLPVLFGGNSGSGSLDTELGKYGVVAWAVCLLVGSVVAAVGEFWRGHTWTALVLESAGLSLLVLGGTLFSVALFAQGEDARTVALLLASYAAACAWRIGQCIRRLKWLADLISEINYWDDLTRESEK
jgi:hypothetical protein